MLGAERRDALYDYVSEVTEALKGAFGEQADIEFDGPTGSGRVWFVHIKDHDADGYRASLDGWIGDDTVLSGENIYDLINRIQSNARFDSASSGYICGLEILREELSERGIYVNGEIFQHDSWHDWCFELFNRDVRIGSFGLSSQTGDLELWFKRADLANTICESSFPRLIPRIVEQLTTGRPRPR